MDIYAIKVNGEIVADCCNIIYKFNSYEEAEQFVQEEFDGEDYEIFSASAEALDALEQELI